MPDQATVSIAIINSSEEILEMLSAALEDEGFRVVGSYVIDLKRGKVDIREFLRLHDPAAVVLDIALPYEENWQFFERLRDEGVFDGRGVVLTSTNKRALDRLVGPTPVHEIIGKPFDLDEISEAVRRAVRDHDRGAESGTY